METSLIILLLAFASAIFPVFAWYFILQRKNNRKIKGRFLLAFTLAGCGGFLFTLVQNEIIDIFTKFIPIAFLVFLFIGFFIEYFKNFMVRLSGMNSFRNIDDVIDLSFATALGFTFGENLVEFTNAFSGNNLDIIGPIKMLKYFLIREFFVLPIHLFTSGIFGYFYGMSLFASDDLQKKNHKDIFYRLFSFVFFFFPQNNRFKAVKIAQGTTLSVGFYALFFLLYQKNPMLSDIFSWLKMPVMPFDEQLILLVAFIIFKAGTLLFFSLMDKKNRWMNQGFLMNK